MNETKWRVFMLAGLLLSGVFACAVPAADSERAALEAAMQRWMTAINSQDEAMLSVGMTEDVELFDGIATATGADAAVRALREMAARGKLVATVREITIAGDVAWRVIGIAQIEKSGVVHARGQALEIWKRVAGEWKLHRQMSARPGMPEDPLTRPSTTEPVLDRPKN
jgi:ketosteroid isomerase-like protein